MPGMYSSGEYDLAGFAVGAVERDALLPRTSLIQEGDAVLGVASSGIHSNGFSLVHMVIKRAGLVLGDPCPFQKDMALGEFFTLIYIEMEESQLCVSIIECMTFKFIQNLSVHSIIVVRLSTKQANHLS